MRLITWIAAFAGLGLAWACGTSPSIGPPPPVDGGTSDGVTPGDDAMVVAVPVQPAVVLVNGLVSGVASSNLTLGDVRVCISGMQYPLPDDKVMPLANYPGVGLGQGLDLGVISTSGFATVDIFNASDLQSDASWQPAIDRLTCAQITCNSGAACRKHVEFQLSIQSSINMLVLTDDVPGQSVKLVARDLDVNYTGTPGSVRAEVANFSGWHSGQNVTAGFGTTDRSGTPMMLADPLGDGIVSTTATLEVPSGDYEGYGLRVDQSSSGDTFMQSLGSIQWVSDPTTAPPTFYDVRENFAFVLIGNPQNKQLASNPRDPSFDGTALHFVAVPYAAGTPFK